RAECLDWLLIIGRRHLETLLHIYTAHYNRERPHRGLALRSPESTNADPRPRNGEIERRDRLGGLIHEYHRAAASASILKPLGSPGAATPCSSSSSSAAAASTSPAARPTRPAPGSPSRLATSASPACSSGHGS